MAVRKYYLYQQEEARHTLNLINQFLNCYEKYTVKSLDLLDTSSNYYSLLKHYFENYPSELQEWASSEYIKSDKYPESLIHTCYSGDKVRSKSEVIIANALYTHKIPYRYECELDLDSIPVYPDFTICHPITQKIYFWEHFGMMDSPSYCEKAYDKLKLYGNHDIFPTVNLISTYETSKFPINSENIQKIIEEYFF